MNRDRIAKAATIVVVIVLLGAVVIRRSGVRLASRPDPAPQDAIYQMLEAARAGNTAAYLARYTGQMRSALNQTIAEKGEAGFKSYLQSSNAEIKGLAVFGPKQVSDNEVAVRVEYVYRERNEVQVFYLVKTAGIWKISRVDNTERIKTLVPYGTPVQ